MGKRETPQTTMDVVRTLTDLDLLIRSGATVTLTITWPKPGLPNPFRKKKEVSHG